MIDRLLEHYGADLHRVPEHGWRSIRCPFHDDKHASARVNLDKDAFACLAGQCGIRGTPIRIIMQREGLDWHGAVEFAEGVLGEQLPDVRAATRRDQPKQRSQWRDRLFS